MMFRGIVPVALLDVGGTETARMMQARIVFREHPTQAMIGYDPAAATETAITLFMSVIIQRDTLQSLAENIILQKIVYPTVRIASYERGTAPTSRPACPGGGLPRTAARQDSGGDQQSLPSQYVSPAIRISL